MSIGTILLIVLIIILLGGFSGIGGGPFYGTGYYGGGGSAVHQGEQITAADVLTTRYESGEPTALPPMPCGKMQVCSPAS
jgi:Protein of unknown function (DUF3309)